MYICVDFDGTVVTHDFPNIGKDIGAVPVLRDLVKCGHKLILFTMRSNISNPHSDDPHIVSVGGDYLTHAVNWFGSNGLPLYGINYNPDQALWTLSPKAYGNLYIDDAALGAPLKMDLSLSKRPFIDWVSVRKYLEYNNIIF